MKGNARTCPCSCSLPYIRHVRAMMRPRCYSLVTVGHLENGYTLVVPNTAEVLVRSTYIASPPNEQTQGLDRRRDSNCIGKHFVTKESQLSRCPVISSLLPCVACEYALHLENMLSRWIRKSQLLTPSASSFASLPQYASRVLKVCRRIMRFPFKSQRHVELSPVQSGQTYGVFYSI